VVCGCSLAALLAAGHSAAVEHQPAEGTWVTDGPVYALAASGDRTFVGGDFTYVGRRTGPGVQLGAVGAAKPGQPSPGPGAFPEVAGGRVNAVAADGSGGWYVGGDFTHVGGLPRQGGAHLVPSSDGMAVDPSWAPAVGGTVEALAVDHVVGRSAPVVYVGGDFTSFGGVSTRRHLVAVDGATADVAGILPQPDAPVLDLAVQTFDVEDGAPGETRRVSVVFVAGSFATLGAPQNNLGAVWGIGSGTSEGALIGWKPVPDSTAKPGVRALLLGVTKVNAATGLSRTVVHLAGTFGLSTYRFGLRLSGATARTVETTNVMYAPNSNAGDIACADPGCFPSVNALARSEDGSVLYLGGRFTQLNAASPRKNLGAIDGPIDPHAAGTVVYSPRQWNPAAGSTDPRHDGAVHALAHSAANAGQEGVYVGGNFTHLDGAAREGLGALTPSATKTVDDSEALAWDPAAVGGDGASRVAALATTPDTVYAGGSFPGVGGVRRDNLAAFSTSGSLLTDWAAPADAPVNALAADAQRLYVGGSFTTLRGDSRRRLGAVSTSDGALDGLRADVDPVVCPPDDSECRAPAPGVLSLALRDSTLYVGGSFGFISSEPRSNAAAIDVGGGSVQPWAPNPNASVRSLAPTCGTVYAGGGFTAIGGAPRSRIAAVDPATGAATAWDPGADGTVFGVARDQETVYLAGHFANVAGRPRNGLAALDAGSGAATAWNPRVTGDFNAVVVPPGGSTVYAGGRFKGAGDAGFTHLGEFDRGTGSLTGWRSGADGAVHALASDGSSLIAGGAFRQLGTQMQQGFGSFSLGGTAIDQTLRCGVPPPAPPEPEQAAVEPPPPPPPPPRRGERPRDTLAPALTGAGLTNRRFRTGQSRRRSVHGATRGRAPIGTTFTYTLSEPGIVRFAFKRRTPVRCTAPKTKGSCYRWREAGAVRHLSSLGASKVRFEGKVGRRWLRLGRYTARVRAADAAGNRSKTTRVWFTVVRR
jgi:hypothetical protein